MTDKKLVSMRMDSGVWRRVRVESLERGETAAEFVEQAIVERLESLDRDALISHVVARGRQGIPTGWYDTKGATATVAPDTHEVRDDDCGAKELVYTREGEG